MPGPDDLRSVVENYSPHGDSRSHQVALVALSSGRPMWRRSEFDPGHFTASGFVLSPDQNALLLILHGKLDRWLQPGGHIERDDPSVEDAARREVAEETGLSSIDRVGSTLVRIDAHDIPERETEPGHIHIDLGVGFVARTFSFGPLQEVVDAQWISFDDLHRFDVDEAVLGGAREVLRMASSAG